LTRPREDDPVEFAKKREELGKLLIGDPPRQAPTPGANMRAQADAARTEWKEQRKHELVADLIAYEKEYLLSRRL
jgi:hypothetical protein